MLKVNLNCDMEESFDFYPLRNDDELEDRINQLREQLIQIAKLTGLNSKDTICYSQKLDQLITIYQKKSHHCLNKRRIFQV